MARRSRRWEPNAIHHAVARAHCGSPIFAMDEDRAFVVRRAVRAFEETGATCLAWSILNNHYHVLVRCPGAPGPTFSRLNTAIAWRVLRYRGEHGSVFQNRYYSGPCAGEASLLGKFAYVLGNPIHHRIVPTVELLASHPWSGLGEILGRRPAQWLDVDAALAAIDPDPEHARRVLLRMLEKKTAEWASDDGDPDEDRGLDEEVTVPADPADTPACAAALGPHEPPVLSVRRTVLEREGWTPDRLVEVACAIVGGEPPGVRSGHRSRGDVAARSVVAFVACDIAGWTMQETAAFLGVGPTALGNARRKGRLRLAELGVEPLDVLARSQAGPADESRRLGIGDRPR
jgi:REP element-mobilizing transposase RayT